MRLIPYCVVTALPATAEERGDHIPGCKCFHTLGITERCHEKKQWGCGVCMPAGPYTMTFAEAEECEARHITEAATNAAMRGKSLDAYRCSKCGHSPNTASHKCVSQSSSSARRQTSTASKNVSAGDAWLGDAADMSGLVCNGTHVTQLQHPRAVIDEQERSIEASTSKLKAPRKRRAKKV